MIFDRTEASYIEEKINEEVPQTRIGKVIEVTQRKRDVVEGKEGTITNHEVTVEFINTKNGRHAGIPLLQPRKGSAIIPNEDDHVIVEFLDSRENFPVARNAVHMFQDPAPFAREGMTRHDYGGVYFEAYGPTVDGELDAQWVRMIKKSEDDATNDEADARIEIDDRNPDGAVTTVAGENGFVEINDTSTKTEITAETDGEIVITSSDADISIESENANVDLKVPNGNLTLAPSGETAPIARKGDEVEVDGIEGEITEGSQNVESG